MFDSALWYHKDKDSHTRSWKKNSFVESSLKYSSDNLGQVAFNRPTVWRTSKFGVYLILVEINYPVYYVDDEEAGGEDDPGDSELHSDST